MLTLCSSGREEGTQNNASPKVASPATNSNAAPATKTTPAMKVELGDAVPAMSELGEGVFTELGLRDAFEKATGIPFPKSVKPKSGNFRVWNEKDYGGKNRSYHTATFMAPPSEVMTLADAIESRWKGLHGANPDVQIYRSPGSGHEFVLGGMKFLPRTIALQLRDRYASYSELYADLHFDPTSGNIALTSYRGTEDTPEEREEPESK